MSKSTVDRPVTAPEAAPPREIELRDPLVAAFLAWLVPGLGHWYQGRRSKATLFFVCILGAFAYGLYLGEGRVVYASWRDSDHRIPWLCQPAVGLPALPAVVQNFRFRDLSLREAKIIRQYEGNEVFSDWFMAPPLTRDEIGQVFARSQLNYSRNQNELDGIGNPTEGEGSGNSKDKKEDARSKLAAALRHDYNLSRGGAHEPETDESDYLQKRLHHFWELGTLFTAVAGLLNILAIYDAWGGPAYSEPAPKKKEEEPDPAASADNS